MQRPASENAVEYGRGSYYPSEYYLQFGNRAGGLPTTMKGFAMFTLGCIGLFFGTTILIAVLCFGGTRSQLWGSVGTVLTSMIFVHYGMIILLNVGYTCRK